MTDKALLEFARMLRADVIQRSREGSDDEGAGDFKENVFTERVISDLIEAGVIDDAQVCYHEEKLLKINGYGFNEDGDRLDLVTSIYLHSGDPESVSRDAINVAVRKARRFFEFCLGGKTDGMERAVPSYDMVHEVHAKARDLERIRILVFTDGTTGLRKLVEDDVGGIPLSVDIWGLERLCRLDSSGQPHESVEIDIKERYRQPLACLESGSSESGYRCFLAMVPGQLLFDLYDEYRGQLLELNVRSFLQAKNKVNSGMQETLKNEPHRFMAYNNGITATAEAVTTERLPGGALGISAIRGLQIVNGGQTTASIHLAGRKGRLPLDRVLVQMKLNEVGPELLEELVPKISRYANSQNKVNDADFSANDPFHRRVEELSRTTWAPGEESQWFYERARGQYQVAKALAALKQSLKRGFESQFPPAQVFNKTDLAKYANAWDLKPHVVSKGNQKNFNDFTLALRNRSEAALTDELYFKRLVAKAILFRELERVVRKEGYEAYKANIVAYTVAYIAFKTVGRLDLGAIWAAQDITEATRTYAIAVASRVEKVLKKTTGNVGEWAKKEDCWDVVRELDVPLGKALVAELLSDGAGAGGKRKIEKAEAASPAQLKQVADCMRVSDEDWARIHKWGITSKKLVPWQLGVANTLATYAAGGWGQKPSLKQAKHGHTILELAQRAGVLDS